MDSDPLRARFDSVDRDNNAQIDVTELGELLDGLGVFFGVEQVRSTFEGIDQDGNGLIDLEELRAWWTSR